MSGIASFLDRHGAAQPAVAVVGLAVPVILVVAVVGGVALNAASGGGDPLRRRSTAERDRHLPAAAADRQPGTQRDAARRRDPTPERQPDPRGRSAARLGRPVDRPAPARHRLPARASGQPDRRDHGRLDRPDDRQERGLQRPARRRRFPDADVRQRTARKSTGSTSISSRTMGNGGQGMKQAVSRAFGIEVDRYAFIGFTGVTKLVGGGRRRRRHARRALLRPGLLGQQPPPGLGPAGRQEPPQRARRADLRAQPQGRQRLPARQAPADAGHGRGRQGPHARPGRPADAAQASPRTPSARTCRSTAWQTSTGCSARSTWTVAGHVVFGPTKYAVRAGGTDYLDRLQDRGHLDRQELPAGPSVRDLAGHLTGRPGVGRDRLRPGS